MDAVSLLREQFTIMHNVIDQMIDGLTPEQLQFKPEGRTMSLAANLAHMMTGEDMMLHTFVTGGEPLCNGEWSGRTGASELQEWGSDMAAWGERVEVDLAQLQQYAQAVYAQTAAYLDSITEADLDRSVDLSGFGMGVQPLGVVFGLMIANTQWHTGEIAAVKGLQGLQGYPF